MKTLYRNGDIVTFNDEGRIAVIKNGYLGVEDDRICWLGDTAPEVSYNETKDMTGKIILPGLYNCHTHASMVLLRGVGSDLPLDKWLFGEVCPIEDKLTADDIEAGSYLAAMEMIAGGTVSFSDMYFSPERTAMAVANSGMRANINRPVQAFDPNERPEDSFRVKEAKSLYEQFNGYADGRVLIDWCIHAEYTCNEAVTRYVADLCREVDGNLHIHLSETEKEHLECKKKYGKTPAEWFESLGAFDCGAFAAHCVTLEDGDIDVLKRHNVSVVHNPTSNLKLGSGIAPIQKYLDRGLNIALGTDGAASNNNLNLFEEIHLAALINNGKLQDPTIMNAECVLKMATVNGATVQRRDSCGKLAVGYKADFIVVDTDRPHMTPCLDVPALLVYSAQASDVVLTVCDGKVLYENGEFKTIDAEKTYYNVKKTVERLYN